MKLKRGIAFILILLLILTPVLTKLISAAEDDEETEDLTDEERGYVCLEEELGDDCGDTESTKEAAFNLIAMAYDSNIQSDCKSSLMDKERDDCWGKTESSSCDIKSTALAILALDYIGEDTEDYVEWLMNKQYIADDLTWYLEIDSINKTDCEVNSKDITISENKKISGSNPTGLRKAYSNYWFEITDLDRNFTISCDEDFITALLYQKPGSSVFYVSSETHSASAYDETEEHVNGYCFGSSSSCDYEGTLWAALALQSLGEDISSYLPYLSAMSEDSSNRKYLPSAFLYIFTGSDEYYTTLTEQQKQGKYWNPSGNKYFDTALAVLALSGVEEADNAKEYLLSIQESSGCWRSDTAFILHAGWPKAATTTSSGGSITNCESYGYYCVSSGQCGLANELDNFYCPTISDVCCQVEPEVPTCSEKQGIICPSGQECTGSEVTSSDTNYCCLASCQEIETTNECEDAGYYCQSSCSNDEEEKTAYSNACDIGDVCCGESLEDTSSNWWLIVLLVILIILVVLAILFRNQLKIWLFRVKSKFKSKKAPTTPPRPSSSTAIRPPEILRRPPTRPMPRRPLMRPTPPRKSAEKPKSDQEFEETMKKLKEMSE